MTLVMVKLEQLSDRETLLQAAKLLELENRRLLAQVLDLQRQLMEAKGTSPESLQERLALLEHQLSCARKKLFGDSSEKRTDPAEPAVSEEMPKAKPPGHGPRKQPALQEVPTELLLDQADQVCPCCGKPLLAWENQFESSEQVDVVERRFVLRKNLRQKYRCECGHIETALPAEQLKPGGRYSIDFAVEVAVDKYLDHMPLQRQARAMERDGLKIDSQTLWDQLLSLYHLLEPLNGRLKAHLFSQPVIGADETWWRVMDNGKLASESKRWWIWALSHPTAMWYSMQPGRGKDDGAEVLVGYSGVVMADGYAVYPALAKKHQGFSMVFCWSHARRVFYELRETFPSDAKLVLDLIGRLYDVERAIPPGELFDEVRRTARDQLSRPLINELQSALVGIRTLPGSLLEKAAQYIASRWSGLTRFLEDPRIPLDNNATERGLRGPVIGRKNHYGSRSELGTEVAALFYSLLESAKLNGIDGRGYLRWVAREAAAKRDLRLPHECLDLLELRLDRSRAVLDPAA